MVGIVTIKNRVVIIEMWNFLFLQKVMESQKNVFWNADYFEIKGCHDFHLKMSWLFYFNKNIFSQNAEKWSGKSGF